MEGNILHAMGLGGRNLGRIMRLTTAVNYSDLWRSNQRCSVDHCFVDCGPVVYDSWACPADNNIKWQWRWRWGRRPHQLPFTVLCCFGIWCRIHKFMVSLKKNCSKSIRVLSTMQSLNRDLLAGSLSESSIAFDTINGIASNAMMKTVNPST